MTETVTIDAENLEKLRKVAGDLDESDGPAESPTGQFRFSTLAGVVPDTSLFSISGSLSTDEHEYQVDDDLMVTITTPDGDVVASERVEVSAVSVTRKRDNEGFVTSTERAHKLKAAG